MHPTHISSTSSAPLPLVIGTRLFHRRLRPAAIWAALLIGLAVLLLCSTPAGAAMQGTPTIGEQLIAERQFMGAGARDGVIVRSGPTTEHTTVATLRRNEEVVVVHVNGEFLRILPPDGAFCLVPTSRVELTGTSEGSLRVGRITQTCSVRAGSRVSTMPGEITARLSVDDEVRIIGEDADYYRIVPPKGVFFYVHKNDLQRGREVSVSETARGWSVAEISADAVARNPQQDAGEQVAPPDEQMADATETDAPGVVIPDVVIPTTQPAILGAIRELDERYARATELPLEQQPLDELREGYAAQLAAAEADPAMTAAIPALKTRLQTIELRQEVLEDLRQMQAMRDTMQQREQAIDAEKQELAQRAESAKVSKFTAVGQLQASTLQIGSGSLFRLCDPANGRTLIYLRAEGETATTLARNIEKFIGVRGETVLDEDLDLKFIKVAEISAVDPQQLFKTVAAEIFPPSLTRSADAAE